MQLPADTCVVKGAIFVPGSKTIRGAANATGEVLTVLVQAANAEPSERLFNTAGDGIVFENLVLDGNRAVQTADEHRAGIFVRHANTIIINVRSHHFTGDGFYLFNGAVSATVAQSQFYNNQADDVDVTDGWANRRQLDF